MRWCIPMVDGCIIVMVDGRAYSTTTASVLDSCRKMVLFGFKYFNNFKLYRLKKSSINSKLSAIDDRKHIDSQLL